jgi:putative SOS response-associated peptidase YedK
MCGRFTQAYSWSEVVEFLWVIAPAARDTRPRYNVSA